MKEVIKKQYCKKFTYDNDINNFLKEHPDYKISHIAGAKYSIWVIFEYYEVYNK